MSPTYISGFVVVLAQVLGYFGIPVVADDLTTTFSTIATVVAGLVVLYRRWAKGDITLSGSRKA